MSRPTMQRPTASTRGVAIRLALRIATPLALRIATPLALRIATPLALLATFCVGLFAAGTAHAQTLNPNVVITNGQVSAQVLRGNTLYLGGSFSFVGPVTGAGVPVDSVTALPLAGFPRVNGTVLTAVPDGAGGWYIGGQFTSVGASPRTNLARVLADNSVSPWNPGANGLVRTMLLRAGILYVGGDFLTLGVLTRNHIGAIDAVSGAVTAWDPNADNSVRTFAAGPSILYVGGQFTNIGGLVRNRIAAVDFTTGQTNPLWDPNATGLVLALAFDPATSTLYVGGTFTQIDGVLRRRLAALDALTGFSTAWDPAADNAVFSLIASGSTVYVGGQFNNVGGQQRSGVAALDAVTGAASSFSSDADNIVQAMALAGSTLYVGGDFLNMGGKPRSRIAALDAVTGQAADWNPSAFSTVSVITFNAGKAFVGGSFSGIGGVFRNNLAAVDVTTGQVTAWDPNANNQVQTMLLTNDALLVGGNFSSVGSQLRNALAALDLTNGNANAWNPNCNGAVSALAVAPGRVYAGGVFTTMGGLPHANLAAVDAATGATLPWTVDTDGPVFTIDASTPSVLVGGNFTLLGGLPRNFIGAANPTTGALTPWIPNANALVTVIKPACDRIYTAGVFTGIGGQPRNRVAALDATTGLASSWAPDVNGPVLTILPTPGVVYVGGVFNTVGLLARNRIAALDPQTGLASAWDPNSNGTVRSLVTDAASVYVGGVFSSLTGAPSGNLAAITPDGSAPCPVISLSLPPLRVGVTGTAYSSTITASGGIAPYCYAITSGALPAGLVLDPATGILSGIPSAAGNSAFTVTATDTRGCPGSVLYELSVTSSPVVNVITVGSGGPCLTPTNTLVNVPFTLTRGDATGLRAVSVTFQLDPLRLRLNTPAAPASNVHLGTWASTFANRTSQVVDQGGGRYTVDLVLLGAPCGATTSGTLFTLDLAAQATAGTGTITVTSALARDCANAPVDLGLGAGGSVGVLTTSLATTPATLASGLEGAAYNQALTGSGGVAPYTFALSTGTLPPGLTLSAAGVLSGTCSQQGTFPFTLLLTEATGCSGTQAFLFTVTCPPITVGPAFLADGSVGTPYVGSVAATGGVAPYTFSVLTGTLPAGLTLSAAGALTGTPTAVVTTTFMIMATDAGGCTGTKVYTVDAFAAPANSFVAANTTNLAISTAHPCLNVPVTFTRGEAASARELIVSLQLDPAHLALCTTPAASFHLGTWTTGFANANMVVTDNGGGAYTVDVSLAGAPCGMTTSGTPFTMDLKSVGADGTGTITVTSVKAITCAGSAFPAAPGAVGSLRIQNTAITLAPTTLPNAVAGTVYSQTITAQTGGAPFVFVISAGALPAGLTLSGAGVLSGTATTVGNHAFTVSVSDVAGVPGSRAYTMSVTPGAAAALTYTVQPTTVVAGVTMAPAVQLKVTDAFGNAVPAQPVALSLVGAGTLTGGAAVISDANGLANFATLSVNLSGSNQLSAATGLVTPTSSTAFIVSPAPPASLTFAVSPSNVAAGVAIAPAVQVKVKDAFGNGVPGRLVSLSLVGTGVLTGGGAVTSDANGLATFAGLRVNLMGSKLLSATSGVLPSANSSAFTVSAGPPAALTYAVAPSNVAAGAAIAPAVQVKVSDAFGNGVSGQSVTLVLVGTGTLTGGGALISDGNGLTSFAGVSIDVAGSKQLTAASGALTPLTSAAFTVSFAAAAGLSFSVSPSTVVAGVTLAPAVQVKVSDAFGNGVAGRAVTLALVGTGALVGGGAVTSDVSGLATFAALSVNLTGSKQLTASSGVLSPVTSIAFTVNAAAPAALAFNVGPSNVVAGVAMAPAVKVKVSDGFGNAVPGQSVALALVGTGALSGGGAVITDVTGLATFATASVNLVGSKQLTASSGALTPVTSAAFSVSSAAASALTFVVGPSTVASGGIIAPAVQVKASDAFGNAVSGQVISLVLVGTGTLTGGGALTSDVNGLVSFAALSINSPGAKQLTASSGVVTPVTSASFNVSCPLITVTQIALPDAKLGIAYSQAFTASGGTAPYTFTVTTGVLPAGLTLSPAGVLSGTPTTAGTLAFTVTGKDALNCTGAATFALSVFVDPALSHILPVTTGLCVTTTTPCVSVPFNYQRGDATAAGSAHVVFQLDPRFTLCTPAAPATSIRVGSWLASFTNKTFQVVDNGGGNYTVDVALIGAPCGPTTGGTLFTADVTSTGADGVGNLTVTSCRVFDCANVPLPAQPGAAAPLNVDHVAPARITDLVSLQLAPVLVIGGPTDSLTTIRLTWTPNPGSLVSLYRAPFGSYPEYDDLGGTLPDSTLAPAGPWVLVNASAATPFADRPPVRGSWHYVAFVSDSCGNRGAVSNQTRGSLDYLLGDVSNNVTRGVGNDRVGAEDISVLGSHYGLNAAQITAAGVEYLDVGPTLNGTVSARPTTDDLINFEDLAIMSLNFKITPFGAGAHPAAPPVANEHPESFQLNAPSLVEPGDDVSVLLHVDAGGAMHAFSAQLAWDPYVVQPVDMVSTGFVEGQGGVVLSAQAGDVDAALLGVGEYGMLGAGDVATLHFHVLRAGDPRLRIDKLMARDSQNRPIEPGHAVAPVVVAAPAHTLLLAPAPNPARDQTTLAFGLAQRGTAELAIYSVDGRRVRTLAHGPREAGVYRITWRGDDDGGHRQGPGIYWARLSSQGRSYTQRLVFLR